MTKYLTVSEAKKENLIKFEFFGGFTSKTHQVVHFYGIYPSVLTLVAGCRQLQWQSLSLWSSSQRVGCNMLWSRRNSRTSQSCCSRRVSSFLSKASTDSETLQSLIPSASASLLLSFRVATLLWKFLKSAHLSETWKVPETRIVPWKIRNLM